MSKTNKKKIKYLSIITILFFLILNSCSDDNKYDFSSLKNKQKSANIKEIKNWYNQLGIEKRMYDTLTSDLITTYIPKWDKARYSEVNDSTNHTIIPLSIISKKGDKELVGKSLNNESFLLVKNNNDFYFGNFFPDENSKQSSDENFLQNGTLILIDVISRHQFTYIYKNGNAQFQKPKLDTKKMSFYDDEYIIIRSCAIVNLCTWYTICPDGIVTLAPSRGGSCNPPYHVGFCRDGTFAGEWKQRTQTHTTIECQDVLWPIPPKKEPNWGGGGSFNEIENPLERIASLYKSEEFDQFPKDPCDAIKKANELTSNPQVISKINDIKNKTLENGAYIYTSSNTDMINKYLGPHISSPNESSISIGTPSWDSSKGYATGFIHNHPNGGAPSPSDIFVPAQDLIHFASDKTMSYEMLKEYIKNYTSIVVSGEYVYTITIRDPFFFALAQNSYQSRSAIERARFKSRVKKFINNTEGTKEDVQKGGDASLLDLYGRLINISKQKIGEPNTNKALIFSNGVASFIEC